jgi:hypothetical protein
LSDSTVTTDVATGLASFTLYADQSNQNTRTATVVASCIQCAATPANLLLQINGATVDINPASSTSNLLVGDKPTMNAVVKSIGTNSLQSGIPVTFSSSDTSILTVTPNGSTNSLGVATAVVTAVGQTPPNSTVYITASSMGNSGIYTFNSVGPAPATPLNIVASSVNSLALLPDKSVLYTDDSALISVSAPNATSINYASTIGGPGAFTVLQQPNAGNSYIGKANFSSLLGGKAVITVADDKSRTATVTLYLSPPTANKIILTASPTTLGLASNTNKPFIQLKAQALFSGNGTVQGVANVPVFFSMSGGPNSGENLSPPYALTDFSGYAYANFYSGTAATSTPIVVSAQIGTLPSTTYVASTNLTIGGTALSVAFGPASVLRESSDKTLYIMDYSVQVADVGGNPVEDATVTLSLRPVAFSLGTVCKVGTDPFANVEATYCSEDANGNGLLDSGEDTVRKPTTVPTVNRCTSLLNPLPANGTAGSLDHLLTPANSVAGTVPVTVKTGTASTGNAGNASFSLTYLKASAIWVVDMLTATVNSGGTESTTSTIFRLPASEADVKLPDICHLPDSPFAY